jgi:release factor glutamine methyltransferase
VSDGQTVADALRAAATRLGATSPTPRLDAELLMAQALGVSRSHMLLQRMGEGAPAGFDDLLDRRAAHEPVAYILGHQEFYGREFRVTRDTLIPRADSEAVVEAALEAGTGPGRVLDMGTGTGALLLTVLAEQGGEGVGIDRSAAAIAVAAENAAAIGVSQQVRLLTADWTMPGWNDGLGQFGLVLCNPPYVEADAELDPDVRDFEPASALFAGHAGLDDYRVIIPQLGTLLLPGGVAVLEIGAMQYAAVSALARESGFAVTLRRDLAGRPRALVLR